VSKKSRSFQKNLRHSSQNKDKHSVSEITTPIASSVFRKELGIFSIVSLLLLLIYFLPSYLPGQTNTGMGSYHDRAPWKSINIEYQPPPYINSDHPLNFYPWLHFASRWLQKGKMPLWYPHMGFGQPFIAFQESALFNSFHIPFHIYFSDKLFAWVNILKLFFAALLMFTYLRSQNLSFWSSSLGGIGYSFCSYFLVFLQNELPVAALYFPALLLFTDMFFQTSRMPIRILLATTVGLCTVSGHSETSMFIFLAAGFYFAFRWSDWCKSLGQIRMVLTRPHPTNPTCPEKPNHSP